MEFDTICVCPLIDHGQQPLQMHTEVLLLYNIYAVITVYKVYKYIHN